MSNKSSDSRACLSNFDYVDDILELGTMLNHNEDITELTEKILIKYNIDLFQLSLDLVGMIIK